MLVGFLLQQVWLIQMRSTMRWKNKLTSSTIGNQKEQSNKRKRAIEQRVTNPFCLVLSILLLLRLPTFLTDSSLASQIAQRKIPTTANTSILLNMPTSSGLSFRFRLLVSLPFISSVTICDSFREWSERQRRCGSFLRVSLRRFRSSFCC